MTDDLDDERASVTFHLALRDMVGRIPKAIDDSGVLGILAARLNELLTLLPDDNRATAVASVHQCVTLATVNDLRQRMEATAPGMGPGA